MNSTISRDTNPTRHTTTTLDLQTQPPLPFETCRILELSTPSSPATHLDVLDTIPRRHNPTDRLLVLHPLTPDAASNDPLARISSSLLWFLHARLNELNLRRWESGKATRGELEARRVSWGVVHAVLMRRVAGLEGEVGVDGVFGGPRPGGALGVLWGVVCGVEVAGDGGVDERLRALSERSTGASDSGLEREAVFDDGELSACRQKHLEAVGGLDRGRLAWWLSRPGRDASEKAGAKAEIKSAVFDAGRLKARLDEIDMSLVERHRRRLAGSA